MERAILVIVLLVAIVGVVGLFTRYDFTAGQDALSGGMTGNVVQEAAKAATVTNCASCAGYAPVCGQLNHKYVTYPNPCEARCAGAEIAASVACEDLPSN